MKARGVKWPFVTRHYEFCQSVKSDRNRIRIAFIGRLWANTYKGFGSGLWCRAHEYNVILKTAEHQSAPLMSAGGLLMLNCVSKELKAFGVQTLVRVCESTYDKAPVEKEGIEVLVRRLTLFSSKLCSWPAATLAHMYLQTKSHFCCLVRVRLDISSRAFADGVERFRQ